MLTLTPSSACSPIYTVAVCTCRSGPALLEAVGGDLHSTPPYAALPVQCPLQRSPCLLLLHHQHQHHPHHHPEWHVHPASAAAQCVLHHSPGFHLHRRRPQIAAAKNTPGHMKPCAPEGNEQHSHTCWREAVTASPHMGPRALIHHARQLQGTKSWLLHAGSSAGKHFAWQPPPCVPTCACKPEDGLVKAHLPGGALKQLLLVGVLADQAVHHHLHTRHT